jgi:hypothetical protein
VLRRRFCSDKEKATTGGWKILHNEELHNFYPSNIVTMIKLGMMR